MFIPHWFTLSSLLFSLRSFHCKLYQGQRKGRVTKRRREGEMGDEVTG